MGTMIPLLLFAILLSGCGVGQFTAKTSASYVISPDGNKTIHYESNKEQQGLDVALVEEKGDVKSLTIHVDRAITPEAAIAAALQSQTELIKLIQQLITSGMGPK